MQKMLEKNRWMVLVSCIMTQWVCNFPGLWAVFQPYVAEQYNYESSAATLVMAMCVVFFGFISIIGGRMNDRVGPRKTGIVGVALITTSFVIAYLLPAGNPVFMYLGFCLPYGGGCGFLYQASITNSMRWYADKKGFFSGMSGAFTSLYIMVVVFAAEALLVRLGARGALLAFGAFSLVVGVAVLFFMVAPTPEYLAEKDALGRANLAAKGGAPQQMVDFTPAEMLRTKQYYFLVIALAFIVPSMQLVSPQLVSLCMQKGLTKELALSGASIGAAAAALGRFTIPLMSDKFGRKRVISISWVLVIASAYAFMRSGGIAILGTYALLCVFYSGAYALAVPFTNDMFGFKNSGANSGFVNIASSVGSFGGPLVLTAVTPLLGTGAVHIVGIAGACIALASLLMIDTDTAKTKDEMDRKLLQRSEKR